MVTGSGEGSTFPRHHIPHLLPFMLESEKVVTVYNPQGVMRLFDYNKGVVILTGVLSVLSGSVAEARFTGHGVSQIPAGKERFFWPRLNRVGLQLTGGLLFSISA